MKFLILTLALIFSANAFATDSCEEVVLPLAVAMAKANRQHVSLMAMLSVDSYNGVITVFLVDKTGTRHKQYSMLMDEEYTRIGTCKVKQATEVEEDLTPHPL
jgi:hypothetical protein